MNLSSNGAGSRRAARVLAARRPRRTSDRRSCRSSRCLRSVARPCAKYRLVEVTLLLKLCNMSIREFPPCFQTMRSWSGHLWRITAQLHGVQNKPLASGQERRSAGQISLRAGRHENLRERCRIDFPAENRSIYCQPQENVGLQRPSLRHQPTLSYCNKRLFWTNLRTGPNLGPNFI
jgi:hypothetical protein